MKHEPAPLRSWLVEPMPANVSAALDRLRRAPDIRQIAVMPDAHLATDVCVGTVFATDRLLYPQAVGGDIGCGMLAMAYDVRASALADGATAGAILNGLERAIPMLRHHRAATVPMPAELLAMPLSHPSLAGVLRDAGTLQFGTLGSGNHFAELQADENDTLWLMIHSGSRSMGQAIRDHHLAGAKPVGSSLYALDADEAAGQRYLNDVAWARAYADANRRAMAERVSAVLASTVGAKPRVETIIAIDHNHVTDEIHDGQRRWVHRKGAMPAGDGVAGVVPGSMGTVSFHVEGRGCEAALRSSAHGAGRSMSRDTARKSIGERSLHRQMLGVWYDYRRAAHLREEAPSAYKDVRAVMRAQRDFVKITRTLRPVLNYKGR